jgi:hypothetical protein
LNRFNTLSRRLPFRRPVISLLDVRQILDRNLVPRSLPLARSGSQTPLRQGLDCFITREAHQWHCRRRKPATDVYEAVADTAPGLSRITLPWPKDGN